MTGHTAEAQAMNDVGTDQGPVVEVSIDCDGWAAIGNLDQLARDAVRATWAAVDTGSHGEISILFTTDARMRSLSGCSYTTGPGETSLIGRGCCIGSPKNPVLRPSAETTP